MTTRFANLLIDTADALAEAGDADAAWQVINRVGTRLGARSVNAGVFLTGTPTIAWMRSTMNPDWLEEYAGDALHEIDPLLKASMAGEPPRLYDVGFQQQLGPPDSRYRQLHHRMMSYGYRYMLTHNWQHGPENKCLVLGCEDDPTHLFGPGTARAFYRAVVHGEPLIDRVISLTGLAMAQPRNVRARIGTPLGWLAAQFGGFSETPGRLVMGGPMMGIRIPDDGGVPLVKASNCLLAMRAEDVRPPEPAMPCIRCGACADVCPAKLLPQQLYWHAKAREFDKAQRYNLFDCIECGACAAVCPSHIPLVQYYRFAKTEIWAEERERLAADAARVRHEERQRRMEREAAEKEAARAARKKKASGGSAADDDPIARAKTAAAERRAISCFRRRSRSRVHACSASMPPTNAASVGAVGPAMEQLF